MEDGKFTNISRWCQLVLRGVPRVLIHGTKVVARATRWGTIGMVELIAFCGEDFGFEDPEAHKQDGIAFRITHPYWQFAPVTQQFLLDGSCSCSMLLQGGDVGGRYGGQAGVKEYGSQGYVISLYLNETGSGKNGRMEKVCLQFPWWNPAKPFDIFQSGWMKATVISEFTKIALPQTLQYRLAKPEPFTPEEKALLAQFAEAQEKYA